MIRAVTLLGRERSRARRVGRGRAGGAAEALPPGPWGHYADAFQPIHELGSIAVVREVGDEGVGAW